MGYALDVTAIVDQVIRRPEIDAEIGNSENRLNEDFLRQRLLERAAIVRDQSAPALELCDEAEQQLVAARELRQATTTTQPSYLYMTRRTLWVSVAAFVVFIIARFDFLPGNALAEQAARYQWPILALLATPFAMFGMVSLRWRWWHRPAIRANVEAEVRASEARLETARSAAHQAGLEVAQRLAFELVNETTKRFYQDRLFVFSDVSGENSYGQHKTTGVGLAEGLTLATEVATDVRNDMARIFRTMPSASVGVAGPRGIGKTTLLWSLCNSAIPGLDRKKIIAVYTAAPVEYDGRDFLLHIFSGVCRKVLSSRNRPEIRAPFSDLEMNQIEESSGFLRRNSKLGGLLLAFGISTLLVGAVLAILLAMLTPAVSPQGGGAAKNSVRQPTFTETLMSVVDFKVGPMLQWGVLSAILGFGLMLEGQRGGSKRDEGGMLEEAQRHLADINFQRNYSSGWSGALKLPAGVDVSSTVGLQLAQKQKSLPELADNFRRFVELMTDDKKGDAFQTIIIAIDELDKMKTAEAAQQFLNEIKMIFTIPRCFFFISVSENALSNFERRGLSVRDAFDSSFDDIRYVDYLSLSEARRILFRRVLNLPGQYCALCYVLSGGLPRDLIRVTRALLELAEKDPKHNEMRQLAQSMIRTEVQRKIRAASIAAREIALEPEVPDFMRSLATLEDASFDSEDALERYTVKPCADRGGMSEAEKVARQNLLGLHRELDAFFYYALTVYELFCWARTEQEWVEAEEEDRWIAGLAKARQALDIGADIAKFRTGEIRRKNGLKVREVVA